MPMARRVRQSPNRTTQVIDKTLTIRTPLRNRRAVYSSPTRIAEILNGVGPILATYPFFPFWIDELKWNSDEGPTATSGGGVF